MIDFTALTDATVDTFRRIPEVVDILGDADMIESYIYQGASQNRLQHAIDHSPPGSILVAWVETVPNDNKTNGWWLHRFRYILRGVTGGSPLDLLTALFNGVPIPGDGQRWRYCEFMAGTDPARIIEISRQPDEEGIDYIQVTAEILETGDA